QKINDKGTMLGLGEEHLVQVGKRKFAKITIA
ncbi:Tyrosyl-tRNA synthetase, class Ib, partial [Cycloclasticus pugetii]